MPCMYCDFPGRRGHPYGQCDETRRILSRGVRENKTIYVCVFSDIGDAENGPKLDVDYEEIFTSYEDTCKAILPELMEKFGRETFVIEDKPQEEDFVLPPGFEEHLPTEEDESSSKFESMREYARHLASNVRF